MKTAVVILNWNTKGYLQTFLPGLIASTEGMDAEVIVADSASTDGSMEMLAREFPQVRRIPLDKNYGFTGGYNRALKQVEAEYYVLINSDIEITPDWLKPLVAWMDAYPKCGACGPKLRSYFDRPAFEYAGGIVYRDIQAIGGTVFQVYVNERSAGTHTVNNTVLVDCGNAFIFTLKSDVPLGARRIFTVKNNMFLIRTDLNFGVKNA